MKHQWLKLAAFLGLLLATYFTAGTIQRSAVIAADGGAATAASEEVSALMKRSIWEECEYVYAAATPEEIELELDAFRKAIHEDSRSYFDAQFAAGAYVVEGHYEAGSPYQVTPTPDEICARRLLPDGTVGKVVYPEKDFPEAYELMYRAQWLQSHKLNRSEFVALPQGVQQP